MERQLECGIAGRPTDHPYVPNEYNIGNRVRSSFCEGAESKTRTSHQLERRLELLWKSSRIHATLRLGPQLGAHCEFAGWVRSIDRSRRLGWHDAGRRSGLPQG